MKTKYSLGDRIYTLTNYRLEKTFIGTVDEISRELQELMDVATPIPKDSEEYELYSVSRWGDRQLKVEEHTFWEVFSLELKPRETHATQTDNVYVDDPTKIRLGKIVDDSIDNMDDGFIYAPPTNQKRRTNG